MPLTETPRRYHDTAGHRSDTLQEEEKTLIYQKEIGILHQLGGRQPVFFYPLARNRSARVIFFERTSVPGARANHIN